MADESTSDSETFAGALRRALDHRGLTLTAVHALLADHGNPISIATLSYWRSGQRRPEAAASLSAVDDLEQILGLDPGTLSSLVNPTARLGVQPEPLVPFEERARRETEETFAALGAAAQADIREISTHMTAYTHQDGSVDRTEFVSVVQVVRGVVTELPLIDVAPEETDAMSRILDVVGGRLVREHQHPGRLVSGIVIELDEPATAGSTFTLQFTEQLPRDYPARRSAWHATARPTKETLIRVVFPEGADPDWCEEYVESDTGDEVWAQRAVVHGRIAHAMRHGFGPGVLGIRWGGS